MVWNIYGKRYDLTPFLDKHPGGRYVLSQTEDVDDATPLFESYHNFGDKRSIRRQLEQYLVVGGGDADGLQQDAGKYCAFDFASYNSLVERVKEAFPGRAATKSSASWRVQNAAMLGLYLLAFYASLFSPRRGVLEQTACAVVAGFAYSSLMFNVMHDASHFGVSTRPDVNLQLSRACHGWGLWDADLWFRHHSVYHHAYTGVAGKDPDLYHLRPFANKVKESQVKNALYPGSAYLWVVLFFLPGQYVGQMVIYALARWGGKQRLFKTVRLQSASAAASSSTMESALRWGKVACLAASVGLFRASNLLAVLAYFATLNLFYSVNIIFDHDTFESAVQNHYDGNDWLRLQVANSGNFLTSSGLWTRLFGAINFQIEHHLFPNVSSVHYPRIAPIVRAFCLERDIPYTNHATLASAYASYLKTIRHANDT